MSIKCVSLLNWAIVGNMKCSYLHALTNKHMRVPVNVMFYKVTESSVYLLSHDYPWSFVWNLQHFIAHQIHDINFFIWNWQCLRVIITVKMSSWCALHLYYCVTRWPEHIKKGIIIASWVSCLLRCRSVNFLCQNHNKASDREVYHSQASVRVLWQP